jgi:hypothetical protein
MTTHVISLTAGKHRTFSNTQIAQAISFEATHEWQASANVVVRFDRRKGSGLCRNEEEAGYHFEFLYAVVELIEANRMVLYDQTARVE